MTAELLTGTMFKPYYLRSVASAGAVHADTVSTDVHVEGLIDAAVQRENCLFAALEAHHGPNFDEHDVDPRSPSLLTDRDLSGNALDLHTSTGGS